jgi:hypothetical protein
MQEEHDDLDAMLDNPFRGFRPRRESRAGQEIRSERKENPRGMPGEQIPATQPEGTESRAERNHPLELRVLSLEKNELLTAKKLDDIKRIIGHQNERIRLLEEELEILRKALGEK